MMARTLTDTTSGTCPNCGRDSDYVTTCRTCGHTYCPHCSSTTKACCVRSFWDEVLDDACPDSETP